MNLTQTQPGTAGYRRNDTWVPWQPHEKRTGGEKKRDEKNRMLRGNEEDKIDLCGMIKRRMARTLTSKSSMATGKCNVLHEIL